MSSDPELLLRARGIRKVYTSVDAPIARLAEALLRRPSPRRRHNVVLDKIDIDVRRGETLGIMGRNGAGKTTLLAILGRVLEPSAGTVERFGRVATLLEVGAGFNPDFTGRENAELFCGIMGLSAQERTARMPAIEAFAEIGEYFAMPLRTYSSGMRARLGFACAAHVDADLVIIDETLAVGDAAFRVKCYIRIKAMQDAGQTFLLVSHSPNLVANFCSRVVVLEKGRKAYDGETLGGLNAYKDIREGLEKRRLAAAGDATASRSEPSLMELRDVRLGEGDGPGGPEMTVDAVLHARVAVERPVLSFGIRNQDGIVVCTLSTANLPAGLAPIGAGEARRIRLRFRNLLLPGAYFVTARSARQTEDGEETLGMQHSAVRFDVPTGPAPSRGLVDLGMRIEEQGATEPAKLPAPAPGADA